MNPVQLLIDSQGSWRLPEEARSCNLEQLDLQRGADNSAYTNIGPRSASTASRPFLGAGLQVGADVGDARNVLLGEKSTPVEKISGSSRGWGYGGGGTHRGG